VYRLLLPLASGDDFVLQGKSCEGSLIVICHFTDGVMKRLGLLAAVLFLGSMCQASIIVYSAALNGANESPATSSTATGFATVTVDTTLNTMHVVFSFSGLTSGDTAAHIHCCVAPGGNAAVATMVPTFTGFPAGLTSGTYDNVIANGSLFDLTSLATYNPSFVSAEGGTAASAEAALLAGWRLETLI
jgi:hypothetical protein